MIKQILKYIDLVFLMRFFCVFIPLFYFNIFFLGITDPKNYYSPFLDQHLNYIKWLTFSINYMASMITHAFGVSALIDGRLIFVKNGARVLLEYACLGFGIMSFWTAFIVAHRARWQQKLYWTLGGLVAIWFLNCVRIAVLLISMQNRWGGNKYFDHHDMFNACAYAIIALFIYLFYKETNRNEYPIITS